MRGELRIGAQQLRNESLKLYFEPDRKSVG